MIEFIIDYKWYFFIAGEIIFWGSLIGFLMLRYAFNLEKLSKYAIVLWLASDLWLVTIGILDYMRSGTFDRFQIIIVIFVIYALTAGKKDFRRLDRWIQRKIARLKGDEVSEIDGGSERHLYGKEHAKSERKKFYGHFLIFVAIHVGFIFFLGYHPSSLVELIHNLDAIDKDDSLKQVTKLISGTSGISAIWTLILVIDFLWTFSYTIWPKKVKKNQ
ncbi:hypothetical protein [Lentibacillus sp. CBA3610]|uniref:hypothetical protein n=1 Tax=Lentibacillus sp. CBA3610 TaxID=2518176 RepID=UPI001594F3E3|nr:hypothetical protein [Lentibacillus sp. CBA3610]QKY71245.1 hypothetical protein Len3610_18340 [Lentibacillus sp. CBA3610]